MRTLWRMLLGLVMVFAMVGILLKEQLSALQTLLPALPTGPGTVQEQLQLLRLHLQELVKIRPIPGEDEQD